MRLTTLAIALGLAAGLPAAAQPNKCIGPSGKYIFTDQPCEDLPGAKSVPVPAKPAPTASPKAGMSEEERERIRQLEAIMVDAKANSEQKTAAQLEAGNIRRGLDARMSWGDRERREVLTKQLANPDKARREAVLRELRTLYRE